ncbi:hypothetical protein [Brachyspira sp. G79]|uniref:hypothetical protein n=1 Tax=Brachyspira sp. G79 TaxID=1358104 RepID=UPI000BBBF0D8|nr:hypothetical protein [Brachyspira sp. G79]PCG20565.1 hypothetical protein KQ44_11585 [Brachyspira sp. G79]
MKKIIFLFSIFYFAVICYGYKIPEGVNNIKDNNKIHYELNRDTYKFVILQEKETLEVPAPHFFIIIRTQTPVTEEDLTKGCFLDIRENNNIYGSFSFGMIISLNEKINNMMYFSGMPDVSEAELEDLSTKKVNAVLIRAENFSGMHSFYEDLEYRDQSSIQIKETEKHFINGEIEKNASQFIDDLLMMTRFYFEVCEKVLN